MLKKILLIVTVFLSVTQAFATGEPSTYFQIFVPPNNDAVRRDAALIITAIYDSTSFEIIDDGMDGDTDDSKSGMLMAGQSYVLYIRDNGINDDARYASGGVLKWDGDYFIINSNKLVFASQSTNSDWQHDWVPSTDKKSIGQKFILYSPPYTSSKRDVNVFAYEFGTTVTFQKISTQAKVNTGFTDVDFENPVTIFTRTINPGEDIIDKFTDGRDVMEAGETYVILADKPITVQYGALFTNTRDGGGYVPSSNGSSSGELFYFSVPYQSAGEQEIRIVSWNEANNVKLERYFNGNWVAVKSFVLSKMTAGDWVGRTDGNVSYSAAFRVTCTPGKKVSVFEGNWFETGSPGTSDMCTMVSAENGTTSGTKFLTYMAPPGNEANVKNPFTGLNFGGQFTHLYLYAKENATVTVRDAFTNGNKFNKTYSIAAGRYVDCYLSLTEWKNIYNGTGTASGAERPYLLVESDNPVSVMNSNFNDNWMCYVGSSLTQAFTQTSAISQSNAIPTDTVTITSTIHTGSQINNPQIEVIVQDGLRVIESKLSSGSISENGTIDEQINKTVISFDQVTTLNKNVQYTVATQVVASVGNNNGGITTGNTNATIETILTGNVGGQIQQCSSTEVVNVNRSNTSKLIFSKYEDNIITKDSTDSWTASWIDINKDGYDDVFVTDKRSSKPNLIYMNNTTGGFTRGQSLLADSAISMTNTWADIDNDGDVDLLVLNNTRKPNTFYLNNNGVLTKTNTPSFTKDVSYYHGGSFADYDNDGKVDVFMCNYFPTRYNELHKNNGTAGFVKEVANAIPAEANQSVGASWADYDQDGFIDLFVPNGFGFKNSLFHNDGNGTFSKAVNSITAEGGQSVGSCWGDYDNDGDLDLFVTNSRDMGNFLYKNNGNGQFTKITTGEVVTDKNASHGCSFADVDNDGDLDLYITSDKNLKYLYFNNGDGSFTKDKNEIIGFNYGKAFGHAWSDYDRDGDLDLFVATHSNQPNAFFTNNGNANNWLSINLVGTVSNKSAIGADVFLYVNGKVQMREVNSQSGFGGQSSFTQHFGLGTATIIDSIKVKWPSGIVQVIIHPGIKQVLTITETQSSKINGAVYFDLNNNGVKDSNEVLVSRAAIQITPGTKKLYTNNAGYFAVNLTQGNYRFTLLNEKGIVATGNPGSITVGNSINSTDTIWIPAASSCNKADLNIIMGGTAIRKGFSNNQFIIIVTNNGRINTNNIDVKLKAPSSIVLGNPNVAITSTETCIENNIAYTTYKWSISRLSPFESQVINFMHSNTNAIAIGDTVNITGWVTSLSEDCNTLDNLLAQTYKVVGAIDPNDIQVAPVGYGKEGFIMPTQQLTYTIRFQNVGNHPASSVKITDILPDGLDMQSLQVVSQSHDGMAIETKGHEVNFNFDEISLSDSTSDEANSHGYIIFSIKPKAGILEGILLKNKASIQFDHYEAFETNEVLNTIQYKKQEEKLISVKAYPNPAGDVVYVSLDHLMGDYTNKKIRHVELLDMTGKVLLQKVFENNALLRFDIPEYLNGFCFIKITDSEGKVYAKKIILMKKF